MDNMSERQALLVQDPSPHRPRVGNYHRGDGGCSSDDQSASGSGSDDWWGGSGSETGSSSSSFCSGSEDSELDWESEVTERGELFYVESNVRVEREVFEDVAPPVATEQPLAPIPRKRHSTKAKLVRLIRRRNSRRQRSKAMTAVLPGLGTAVTTLQETSEVTNIRTTVANKVTFQDWQEGEAREVTVSVDPCAPHNLGRRATLTETLLGIVTATFADGLRIMVSGFVPQGEALKHRSVKIGDWLRSVDGREVTAPTIEAVLAAVTTPRKVNLLLQRVAGCEVTAHSETPLDSQQKHIYQSPLVQHLVGNIGPLHKEELATLFHGRPIGALYLALEGLSESGPPDEGVLFCYPPPVATNPLGAARGSFLTLHHLVPELSTTPPVSSTCLLKGELMHITYTAQPGGELLLLALPDAQCQLHEALSLTADVVRSLQFSHQTLHRCFSDASNHPALNHQFSLFFTRLLAGGLLPLPSPPCPMPLLFEDTLQAARWLPLPRETQAQLDEALSELEGSDFGDVNDDLNGYQRLFTITGCCIFHKGYLLSSHLQHADLIDVVSFCRQQGLLDLTCRESVRSLVLWRRVYLASCERGLQTVQTAISPYRLPDGKWFLLIVGKGHEMLVVLLESGGCTIRSEGDCGPDVVYVEQVQDVLLRIQKLGIVSVASRWLNKCARPQPCQPDHITLHKVVSPGFLGLTPTKLTSTVVSTSSSSPNASSRKIPEVTSILKRRGPSPERPANTGLLSDRSPNLSGLSLCSEDSASRTASLAESDEAPILGRRAERERERLSDSDSESDCYRSDSQIFESERRQSQTVLAGLENILPSKLTAGEENVMFHYVHLDLTEGILMCPPTHREGGQSQRLTEILRNFRLSAQVIHTLLQNTVHFKKLAGHEVSKTRVNKSLVAIKEHGVLFECAASDVENSKKTQPFTYWVIGRLFFTPQPREVYVCHHDSAPQNMVEIAFRLGLSVAG